MSYFFWNMLSETVIQKASTWSNVVKFKSESTSNHEKLKFDRVKVEVREKHIQGQKLNVVYDNCTVNSSVGQKNTRQI